MPAATRRAGLLPGRGRVGGAGLAGEATLLCCAAGPAGNLQLLWFPCRMEISCG